MAASKTARTIVAAATSNGAGSTTRGTLALTTALGGFLTFKLTNGGTGPTAQCLARILVAHNATLPTAASAGVDWKTVAEFGGGTTLNVITENSWEIPPGVMAVEVEFTGNTGQAVTVEAFVSELTDIT